MNVDALAGDRSVLLQDECNVFKTQPAEDAAGNMADGEFAWQGLGRLLQQLLLQPAIKTGALHHHAGDDQQCS